MLDRRARQADVRHGLVMAEGVEDVQAGSGSVLAMLRVPMLLCLIAVGLVAVHVRAFTLTSPVDELQHIDYLIRGSRGHIVRVGERVGQDAMREEACRGKDLQHPLPPCEAERLRPEDFPGGGYSTASAHPPTYYVLTGIAAQGLRDVLGFESIVTAARLLGAVWLAAGLLLTWALGRRYGLDWPALLGAVLLLASAPIVMHSSATVNPDATALAVGGAVFLAAAGVGRTMWATPVLVAVGVLAGLTKLTNLVAIGAAAIYLLVQVWWSWRDGERSSRYSWRGRIHWAPVGISVLALGSGLVAAAAWVLLTYERALVDPAALPTSQMFAVTSLPVGQLLATFLAFVTPVRESFIVEPLRDAPLLVMFMQIFDRLLIAGVLGTIWFSAARAPLRALALGTGVTMVIAGPLFAIVIYVLEQAIVPPLPRYALALAPALVVVLAWAARRPPWSWFLLALGCVSVAIMVLGLL
jgi:hypothetical protein